MDKPTALDIRKWLPPDWNWARLRFPDLPTDNTYDPAQDVALQKRVDWSIGMIEATTGRPLATVGPPTTPPAVTPGIGFDDVEPFLAGAAIDLTPIAEETVLMAVIQRLLQGARSYINATVLKDYLQSFTAGSYSETRRTQDEIVRGRGGFVANPLVNPWRQLSDNLWLLMTEERFRYWRLRTTGQAPAASAIVGQDWRGTWEGEGDFLPAVWGPGVTNYP